MLRLIFDLFHACQEYVVKMRFNPMCNHQHTVQVPVAICHESAGLLKINVKSSKRSSDLNLPERKEESK